MSALGNGGSAYPVAAQFDEWRGEYSQYAESGMTVRQAYKMAAIKGICANQYFFGATYQGTPEGALDFATRLADLSLAEDAEFARRQP